MQGMSGKKQSEWLTHKLKAGRHTYMPLSGKNKKYAKKVMPWNVERQQQRTGNQGLIQACEGWGLHDFFTKQEYGVTITEKESIGVKLSSFSPGNKAADGNHKGKYLTLAVKFCDQRMQRGHCSNREETNDNKLNIERLSTGNQLQGTIIQPMVKEQERKIVVMIRQNAHL